MKPDTLAGGQPSDLALERGKQTFTAPNASTDLTIEEPERAEHNPQERDNKKAVEVFPDGLHRLLSQKVPGRLNNTGDGDVVHALEMTLRTIRQPDVCTRTAV